MNEKDTKRFWSKVEVRGPDDCWLWQGTLRNDNYGVMRVSNRTERAPRLAWLAAHNEWPGDLCICHRCDNPRCCNPAHLFLGTRAENLADMCAKGRYRGGWWKLTDEQVVEILAPENQQVPGVELARRFAVSDSLISMIRLGKHRQRRAA